MVKKGLLKRLKNIEGRNEEQLKNQLKLVENASANKESFKRLKRLDIINQPSEETLDKIKKIDSGELDHSRLVCVHTNGNIYDFNTFKRLENLIRSLYQAKILIEEAKIKQYEMEDSIISLKKYSPQKKSKNKIKATTETLNNAEKCFNGREMVVNTFENGIFPLP